MTYEEELLTILMEECAEVIVEASKCKRYGCYTEYKGESPLEKLEKELGDLQCIIELMHGNDMVSYTKMDDQANLKCEKLRKWSNLFQ
jgi:NTP pyrophosphatase (non-canonical NTP hydrolase)